MKKRVLILCTGNSCRSQMAEGLWRHIAGDEWECHSAGSHPSGFVFPLAVDVMKEIGIDISQQRSKSLDEFLGQSFDLVITVCDSAREACPILPDAGKTLHWPFEDPVGVGGAPERRLARFREVRDLIADTIRRHLDR
jgi:arsenate reductase